MEDPSISKALGSNFKIERMKAGMLILKPLWLNSSDVQNWFSYFDSFSVSVPILGLDLGGMSTVISFSKMCSWFKF